MNEKELKTIPYVTYKLLKAKYEMLIKKLTLALVLSIFVNLILIAIR